jgi:peptidoglycan/LPS O-acetylase OafA/YrhL
VTSSTLDRLGEGAIVESEPPADANGVRRFRPDIEGLRGIAVILVVLYHAGVPFLPGGYVGVDVFFVISGFLITLQLINFRNGTPSLQRFYARRLRRLLPSALLVLVVTVMAARLWGPVLQASSTAQDALAATGLVINYRFAASGLDYLQQDSSPSPLLHFWSLAVEEQFYFVWPLLILAVVLLTRHVSARTRTALLTAVIGAVVLFSLSSSIVLTASDAPVAYFSLQTRAWELGIGALVAIGLPLLRKVGSLAGSVMAWAGIALIIASALLLNAASQFPGYLAAVPVAGAALIIVGGLPTGSRSSDAVLGNRVLRFFGSISYTWYLWHWPFLVLAPAIFHTTFNLADNLAMCVLSLWFAVLTSLWLERPLQRIPLARLPWYRIALAGALVTAVVAGSVVLFPPTVDVPAAATGVSSNSGPVTPTVEAASADTPKYPAQCIAGVLQTTQPVCDISPDGNESSVATGGRVVLLGDSHAGQWYPAVRSIADTKSLDVQVLNKVGCPLADVTIVNPQLSRAYTECDQWRTAMLKRLDTEPKPSVIFISALNDYNTTRAKMSAGWARTIARLQKFGVPIIYLVDTPKPTADVPGCLATSLEIWSACDFARSSALSYDPLAQAIAAGKFKGVVAIDENSYLCPGTGARCPVVRAGVMLYRDDSHLTNTAASTLTPLVESALRKLNILQ